MTTRLESVVTLCTQTTCSNNIEHCVVCYAILVYIKKTKNLE